MAGFTLRVENHHWEGAYVARPARLDSRSLRSSSFTLSGCSPLRELLELLGNLCNRQVCELYMRQFCLGQEGPYKVGVSVEIGWATVGAGERDGEVARKGGDADLASAGVFAGLSEALPLKREEAGTCC